MRVTRAKRCAPLNSGVLASTDYDVHTCFRAYLMRTAPGTYFCPIFSGCQVYLSLSVLTSPTVICLSGCNSLARTGPSMIFFVLHERVNMPFRNPSQIIHSIMLTCLMKSYEWCQFEWCTLRLLSLFECARVGVYE